MFSRKEQIIQFIVWSIIISVIFVSACSSHKIYKNEYNDIEYSFKYDTHNQLILSSRVLYSPFEQPPKRETGWVTICVDEFPHNEQNNIDQYIERMHSYIGYSNFFFESENLTIGGINSEYIYYFYGTYDIAPVAYQGYFVSLVYEDCIIDIDFIASDVPSGRLEEAFELFVNTFEIRKVTQ